MNQLQDRLGRILPDWFLEMFSLYAISGAYIDFPSEPDDISMQIAKPDDIFDETSESYPGLAIKDLGYVCFGTDPTGGGNPFFIPYNKGSNPPVFQVYHDVSDQGEEIEKEGMVKIAGSLSEFFANAKVVN
jgi:hypothetical protein